MDDPAHDTGQHRYQRITPPQNDEGVGEEELALTENRGIGDEIEQGVEAERRAGNCIRNQPEQKSCQRGRTGQAGKLPSKNSPSG
jgi:hypothetical protein